VADKELINFASSLRKVTQHCERDRQSLGQVLVMVDKGSHLYSALPVLELAVRHMEKVVLGHRAKASRAANSDRS
jgi:hypothetical protein